MGVFDFLDKMARGEPFFEDKKKESSPSPVPDRAMPDAEPEDPETTIHKGSERSFPKVLLDRRLIVNTDSGLKVYGRVKNSWPEEAWVEEVRIFNIQRRMSESLHGHEEDELELYVGAPLTKQYSEAFLRYRVLNKATKKQDYFQSVYHITYTYDPKTNTQVPNEAHFVRIDDIFG